MRTKTNYCFLHFIKTPIGTPFQRQRVKVTMLKSLDHVNMLRLHEAFRDGQRTLVPGEQNGAWTGLAHFGNMKRWRGLWNFQKKMGRCWKMNVSSWGCCSWKDFANQFWRQFEYDLNHFFCGLLYRPLCSALLFWLDMIAKTTMCFQQTDHIGQSMMYIYIYMSYTHNMQVIKIYFSVCDSGSFVRFPFLVDAWTSEGSFMLMGFWMLVPSRDRRFLVICTYCICTPTVSIPFLLLIVDASESHLPHWIYPRLYVPYHRTLRWRFVGRTPGNTTKEPRKCSQGWVKDGKRTIILYQVFRELWFCHFLSIFVEKGTGKTGLICCLIVL